MKTFQFMVTDPQGMHARPAGTFVKAAGAYESKVTIVKGDKKVNGKGLLGIMGLGIKCGEEVVLEVEGADEEVAAKELEKFLQENL